MIENKNYNIECFSFENENFQKEYLIDAHYIIYNFSIIMENKNLNELIDLVVDSAKFIYGYRFKEKIKKYFKTKKNIDIEISYNDIKKGKYDYLIEELLKDYKIFNEFIDELENINELNFM